MGEEWEKQARERALERVKARLEKEPLTEDEIWTEVVGALGAEKGVAKTAGRLRRLYNLRYKRKISSSTANMAVVSNLKKVAQEVKEKLEESGVKKTERIIQFGKDYHGYIFYKNEERLKAKVEEIVLQSDSTASHVLKEVNERGYVFESELPYQRRLLDLAADLLEEFSLAKKSRVEGRYVIHRKGFDLQSLELEAESEGEGELWEKRGWRIQKNFYAGTWVLGAEGPKVKKFKFDAIGFDPKKRQLHIALVSGKTVGKGELRDFRMRAVEWGLPSTLHAMAPGFTAGAESYAKSWGILLEKG